MVRQASPTHLQSSLASAEMLNIIYAILSGASFYGSMFLAGHNAIKYSKIKPLTLINTQTEGQLDLYPFLE